MGDLINIDTRPDVAVDMPGRIERDESGEARIIPFHKARWRAVVNRLIDQVVVLRIIRKKKRTLPQNAYLWGVVYVDVLEGLRAIAEEAGESVVFDDDEDLHDAMKWKFLRRQRVMPGGELVETLGSSAKLTVEQFSAFVEQISAWAGHYGISVRSASAGEILVRDVA